MKKKLFILLIILSLCLCISCIYNNEAVNTIEEKNIDYSKEELNARLLNIINEKNFDEVTKNFLIEIFDELYKSYPTWKNVYKDLPEINKYIYDNLIMPLKNIGHINLYRSSSKEAEEIRQIGTGYTAYDENEELYIDLIYDSFEEISEELHLQDLEALFHEIIHCKQLSNNMIIDLTYNDEEHNTLYRFLMEGGATFNARFISTYNNNTYAGYGFCKSDNSLCLEYNKETGIGGTYIMYMYSYDKMVYILGYDVINKYEKGLISDQDLRNMLQEKTNIDVFNIISKACNEKINDVSFDNIIKLEKIFLNQIKNDINNLDSYDKTVKYIDIYRNFKIKYFPKIGKKEEMYSANDDIFDDYFEIDEIDNLLIDKIIEYNIFKTFSKNDKLNRMAIKVLLKGNKYSYFENNNVFESIRLPFHLNEVKYNYSEKNNDGEFILKYPCDYFDYVDFDKVVYLDVKFTENEIKSIKGYNPQKIKNINNFYTLYNK